MRWAGHVAHMGEIRNAYIISVENLEWKKPLRRTSRRWELDIRFDCR